MRAFIVTATLLLCCSSFFNSLAEQQERKLEQIVFEQISNIVLGLGDITSNPNDPDVAETFLKNIISSAFVIGKKIATEDKKNKRSRLKYLDGEMLWDRIPSKDKNELLALLTANT